MAETSASDIPKHGWVDRLAPDGLVPYVRLARLDRPIGTWLLLFPCWWGTALAWAADPALPAVKAIGLALLFGIGAVVMRAAGCTFNDIADRDFDGRVARTADRPIPSGAVSVRQAVAFLGGLLLLGAAVLLSLNWAAVVVGLCSLPLVFIYPFAKRFTYWPQLFLGLTFNWGALVGWTAMSGGLGWPAVVLYVAGIAWTLGYDTIYAHQDKEDDALIGLKSTALLLGDRTRPWLAGFYVATILLMAAAGTVAGFGAWFAVALLLPALQLWWQVSDVKLDVATDCLTKFRSNRYFGWLVLAVIVASGVAARLVL